MYMYICIYVHVYMYICIYVYIAVIKPFDPQNTIFYD